MVREVAAAVLLVSAASVCSGSALANVRLPRHANLGLSLRFGPPAIVSGPECPTSQGGGPWWDKVHALSDTHALGWAESHLIASNDSGRTWFTLVFNDTCASCDASTSNSVYVPGVPGLHTLGHLNLTQGNQSAITGTGAAASTRYFVGVDGTFQRAAGPAVRISGLPALRVFAPGSGEYLTLPDGSLVGVAKSVLATGSGRLSCVAYRSTDGGHTWAFASVVASAEEVPYAVEGPSEGTLALLRNGTLIAIMRVQVRKEACARAAPDQFAHCPARWPACAGPQNSRLKRLHIPGFPLAPIRSPP